MPVDFKFDGGSNFSIQPSEIRVKPPEAPSMPTSDGGKVATPISKGAEITVTWGVQAVKTGALAALRTARGGSVAHSITFTDPAGSTSTYNVLWRSDPEYTIIMPFHVARFGIVFEERP